jgi:transposase
MSSDDVLFGFRLRLFALAAEIGVRPACRAMGVHHSTCYRWKRRIDCWGLEALRVRERRRPRIPNELAAPGAAHPRLRARPSRPGPKRISAELARKKWGGLRISPNGVWRVLRRHGLNTRSRRLALVAGNAAATSGVARARARAPHRGLAAGRAGRGRLLLRSVASRARRARSGSTRRSTSDPASGPSSTPRPQAPCPALPHARRAGRLRARPSWLAAGAACPARSSAVPAR